MRPIAVSMQLLLSSSRPGANDVLEACRHVTGRPEEDNAHECALPPRPYAFIVRPGPFAPCARPVTCLLSWREVRGTLKGLRIACRRRRLSTSRPESAWTRWTGGRTATSETWSWG